MQKAVEVFCIQTNVLESNPESKPPSEHESEPESKPVLGEEGKRF